jgi:hypothetical protein
MDLAEAVIFTTASVFAPVARPVHHLPLGFLFLISACSLVAKTSIASRQLIDAFLCWVLRMASSKLQAYSCA